MPLNIAAASAMTDQQASVGTHKPCQCKRKIKANHEKYTIDIRLISHSLLLAQPLPLRKLQRQCVQK